MMLAELQRLASHLVWLATHALDIGAMTPFFYTFREREAILDLFEEYCGARLTLNCMRIGGVPFDLPDGWLERCSSTSSTIFDARIDEYEKLLTENRIWKKRTIGVGVISAEDAIEWGLTGPPLARLRRRVGHPQGVPLRPLRRDRLRDPDRHQRRHLRPLPGADGGDAAVGADPPPVPRQAARRPGHGKVPKILRSKEGEVYGAVEAPKGELGYFIVATEKGTAALPLPRPAAVLRQPPGPAADGRGAPGRRPRGGHRHARHRPRGDRPMSAGFRISDFGFRFSAPRSDLLRMGELSEIRNSKFEIADRAHARSRYDRSPDGVHRHPADQDRRDAGGAASDHGLPDLRRAQDPGLHAGPARSQPGRSQGLAAADRRRSQALRQGGPGSRPRPSASSSSWRRS